MRSFQKFLIVALSLSASSVALARNPPSLVQQQQADEAGTRSGPGYRDMHWRFGEASAPSTTRVSAGYRDLHWRFDAIRSHVAQTASASQASKRWR